MTSTEIFRSDPYLSSDEATVVAVLEEGLILNKTVFYPEGGGQPGDIGRIANNTFEADVTNTIKSTDGILHLIDNKLGSISKGDNVKIDNQVHESMLKQHLLPFLVLPNNFAYNLPMGASLENMNPT